jgi:hypothetical protein
MNELKGRRRSVGVTIAHGGTTPEGISFASVSAGTILSSE